MTLLPSLRCCLHQPSLHLPGLSLKWVLSHLDFSVLLRFHCYVFFLKYLILSLQNEWLQKMTGIQKVSSSLRFIVYVYLINFYWCIVCFYTIFIPPLILWHWPWAYDIKKSVCDLVFIIYKMPVLSTFIPEEGLFIVTLSNKQIREWDSVWGFLFLIL